MGPIDKGQKNLAPVVLASAIFYSVKIFCLPNLREILRDTFAIIGLMVQSNSLIAKQSNAKIEGPLKSTQLSLSLYPVTIMMK